MTPFNYRSKRGVVLPFALVIIITTSILLGALYSYISYGMRATIRHTDSTIARLAAQSSLEVHKERLYKLFYDYYTVNKNDTLGNVLAFFPEMQSPTQALSTKMGSFVIPAFETYNNSSVITEVSRVKYVDIDKVASKRYVLITFRSTATRNNVTKVIEEDSRFGLERAPVFDYGYFVNNKGWFQGNAATTNGDVRANGDLELDGGCYINGYAYASGNVVDTGRMQNENNYWKSNNQRARPTSPTSFRYQDIPTSGLDWPMGYDANTISNIPYKDRDERLKNNQPELPMPYIGELDTYIDIAEDEYEKRRSDASISNPAAIRYYDQEAGMYKTINYHHNAAGPSGVEDAPDKGCLLIVGTRNRPIKIQGVAVIDQDLLIQGVVEGQGTIYAGRNVHILGNLTYKNPPSWPKPDTNPIHTANVNRQKDLLGLAAKGNIVFGRYDSYNQGTISQYLRPEWIKPYECDPSDADIGYGSSSNNHTFDGNYLANDGGTKIASKEWKREREYVNGRWKWGEYKWVITTTNRKYYESSSEYNFIKNYASTSISQIDAVLYNNHAILGNVGSCSFNGALVCRNEAIIYNGRLAINWDIRIGSDSPDGTQFEIYLPLMISQPHPIAWREIR